VNVSGPSFAWQLKTDVTDVGLLALGSADGSSLQAAASVIPTTRTAQDSNLIVALDIARNAGSLYVELCGFVMDLQGSAGRGLLGFKDRFVAGSPSQILLINPNSCQG
jgi:hypothetical protein